MDRFFEKSGKLPYCFQVYPPYIGNFALNNIFDAVKASHFAGLHLGVFDNGDIIAFHCEHFDMVSVGDGLHHGFGIMVGSIGKSSDDGQDAEG